MRAGRAGSPAARALAGGLGGRVAAVQRRAVHLLLDTGGLVALVPEDVSLHPWAVSAALDLAAAPEGAPFRVAAGMLTVGPLRLDLSAARIVDLRLPDRPAVLPAAPRKRLEVAAARAGDVPLDDALLEALARFAAGGPVGALAEVVGRGPGLTPSGDDILIGILAALDLADRAVRGAGDLRRSLVRLLAGRLSARTTRLSAQLLGSAAEGLYAEPILGLAAALVDDVAPPGRLDHAVHDLLAVGHESGAATLRGVSAGLGRVTAG